MTNRGTAVEAADAAVSRRWMVVTLHACDKATDYALAKAAVEGCRSDFSVPCCQHELNSKISSELLEPVLKYGILKRKDVCSYYRRNPGKSSGIQRIFHTDPGIY